MNPDGYGTLHAEDNEFGVYSAHRYSYRIHNGDLNGLQVLHKCDVRSCVNPDHLFLGTQSENICDMDRKGRRVSVRGERLGTSKLTENQAIEINKMYASGSYRQVDISRLFGVERSVVSAIVQGRTWSHATGIKEKKPKKACGPSRRRFSSMDCQVITSCYSDGVIARKLAAYFKVSDETIYSIKNGSYLK